ncbi:hypothetical protein AB0C84_42875 [Actinomadura sp. NPDC048955]|uniref:hypothetical protein n=1 Tax=Actinomadura sp. NPDC048955 TaxID=3158228 RepID=UPI0033ECEADD
MIRRWRDLPVPYITTWSAETSDARNDAGQLGIMSATRPHTVKGFDTLFYRNEQADDRDMFGMLWNRMPHKPGVGYPVFKSIHPRRQPACMRSGACQICASPGSVWMISAAHWAGHYSRRGAAPFTTHEPPVCVDCAKIAMRHCPRLSRDGSVLLTATKWAPTAVRGFKADPIAGTLLPDESMMTLPGTDPPPAAADLRLFLATLLMATLWQPVVLAAPEDSPGLGSNLAPLAKRPE